MQGVYRLFEITNNFRTRSIFYLTEMWENILLKFVIHSNDIKSNIKDI